MKPVSKSIITAILTAFVLAAPCFAAENAPTDDNTSGVARDYYRLCPLTVGGTDESENVEQMITEMTCSAYTTGLMDGISVINAVVVEAGGHKVFGESGQLNAIQFHALLILYMQRHPEKLSLPTMVVALQAFRDAYPPQK